MSATPVTTTVYLATGATTVVANVVSIDIAGGALVLYGASANMLATFASGQWRYVISY